MIEEKRGERFVMKKFHNFIALSALCPKFNFLLTVLQSEAFCIYISVVNHSERVLIITRQDIARSSRHVIKWQRGS
jgi:hypothetical protein